MTDIDRYIERYIAPSGPDWQPPAGHVLVHNRVRPPFGRHLHRLGDNGFRAWVQRLDEEPELVECHCGFAPQVAVHYRPVAPPRRGAA